MLFNFAQRQGMWALVGALAFGLVGHVSAQEQRGQLQATDGIAGDRLGDSVSIDGDVAIVGARREGAPTEAGAAYVYRFNGAAWQQEIKLIAADRATFDNFGAAVAIDGDVAVVGAPDEGPTSSNRPGAAYVYRYSTGFGWQPEAKLTASDADDGDRFGLAVAIEGDAIVVGADNPNYTHAAAYVFRFDGFDWTEEAILTADLIIDQDGFAQAVAISGDRVAVGARFDGIFSGAAYVFHFTGLVWSQEARIEPADLAAQDQFGSTLDLDGATLVVGSRLDDDDGSASGSAYVFDFIGASWSQSAKLTASDAAANHTFGSAVALDGNRIVVGAPTFGLGQSGKAYIFGRSGGSWTEQGYFTADDGRDGDQFGSAISLSGTNAVIAAAGHEPTPNILDNHGAAYVFDVTVTAPADSDGDGLNDDVEIGLGTDPDDADTDDDGLTDGQEVGFGTDPLDTDTDDDGLSDGDEVTMAAGTGCPNPLVSDSDGDNLTDGFEHGAGLDPCDADTDGDGLADDVETGIGTSPTNPDTDGDGMSDGDEVALAAGSGCPDPLDPDSDDDGVLDGDELTAGLGPCDSDFDNDGLSDGNEIVFGTDPNNPDTDGDGLSDGAEVDAAMGTGCPNPLDADSDDDTRSDGAEITAGTNPCNSDTDGDGFPDNVDPTPTTPGVPPNFLAGFTLAIAGAINDIPLNEFLGPNNSARRARRTVLTVTTLLATAALAQGQTQAAIALLSVVENRIDGVSPPPDWLVTGPDQASLHGDVQAILILLDLID